MRDLALTEQSIGFTFHHMSIPQYKLFRDETVTVFGVHMSLPSLSSPGIVIPTLLLSSPGMTSPGDDKCKITFNNQ